MKIDYKAAQEKSEKRSTQEHLEMSKKFELTSEDLEQVLIEESHLPLQLSMSLISPGELLYPEAEASEIQEFPKLINGSAASPTADHLF